MRERGRGGRLRGFRGFRRCRAGQGPGGDRILETRITRRSTKGARRGVEPQITQILEISQMRGGLGPGGDRVLEPRIARRGAEGAEGGGTADCGDSGDFADAGRPQRGQSCVWRRWGGVLGGWPRGTGGPKRRSITVCRSTSLSSAPSVCAARPENVGNPRLSCSRHRRVCSARAGWLADR